MYQPVSDQFIRRLSAAVPEFGLAWACYRAAQGTLAGESTDFFIIGLISIELISLSLLRLIVAPDTDTHEKPAWRVAFSIGATGLSMIYLFMTGIMMVFFMLFMLFLDPVGFTFLVIAGSRRFIWRWSWHTDSADRQELNQQVRRTFRAHWLAIAVAGLVSVGLNVFLASDPDTQQRVGDAFYLAGAAGYFVALGIYLLAGKVPVPAEAEQQELLPDIRRPEIGKLMQLMFSQWISLAPGILLLFFVLGVLLNLLETEQAAVALPLAVGAGAWLLLANAARVLGFTDESGLSFGFQRSQPLILSFCFFYLFSVVGFIFSIPLVFGVTGHEFRTENFPAAIYVGLVISVLGICLVLIRLWPVATLPFLLDSDQIDPVIPTRARQAWRMTDGLDGFAYGAMPAVIPVLMMIGLAALPEPFRTAGLLLNFVLLAPVTTFIALERTGHMARQRFPELGVTHDTLSLPAYPDASAEAEPGVRAGPENEPVIPVPVPFPVPLPETRQDAGPLKVPVGQAGSPRTPVSLPRSYTQSSPVSPGTPEQQLASAVMEGDLVTIDRLIRDGVSTETRFERDSMLLLAIRLSRPGAVSLLLDHGADVRARGINGSSTLHYAAGTRDMLDFMARLIQSGIDVNERNDNGETPLMRALARENLAAVNFLIQEGANMTLSDRYGSNMLYHFVDGDYTLNRQRRWRASESPDIFRTEESTHLEPVRKLLAAGVDPLQHGQYGRHAASLAGARGLIELLGLFLEAGVDLNAPDGSGQSALGAAARSGERAATDYLIGRGLEVDFATAVNAGMTREVAAALEKDPSLANSTSGGQFKYSALSWAVFHGHLDVARLLMQAGADINTPQALHSSVLHLAVRHLPELIDELIERGVDLDAGDGDMNTPLNFAARDDRLDIARKLLEAGADADLSTERGYPPRFFAKSDAMRELLLKYEKQSH